MADWKTSYRNALLDKTTNPPDIRTIIKPNIPSKLYKYGRFNSPYWRDTIFKGKIHLSPAKEFNDPFDCRANFDFQKAIGSGKFRDVLLQRGIPDDEIKLLSQDSIYTKVIELMREDVFVSCLSEVWDSLLMWAHYANNYNGYCIEYDITQVRDYLKYNLYPVLYEDKYIDITDNLIHLNRNSGLICNLAKANEWQYEREWRIVEYREQPFYWRKSISAIYLGQHCSNYDKDEVVKWAKDQGKKVYLIEPSKTEYKLERYRIS